MNEQQLIELLDELVKHPQESEWVEFKLNFHSPEEIGKRLSALSNGACMHNQNFGYLVFGIEDQSHIVKGTSFKAKSHKKGGEDLEHWLTTRLNPRIDFTVHEFDYDESRHISLYIIPAAKNQPVEFHNQSYIRIGSITRKLNEYPEKQAKIWKRDVVPFEKEIAMDNLSAIDITRYLSTETYFDLMKLPYPSTQQGVIDKFIEDGLVIKNSGFAITKLGALLFAKQLKDFESVARKSIRVIVYKGKNKVETEREQMGGRGYAIGFEGLVIWINSQLPANEEIGKALRTESRMYPEVAIRELVANALVHQDLNEKGFPMIEIFSDRIEISNPGRPLVTPERFIDAYLSRNEKLADIMRRLGFCEEKGSGLDKVIFNIELYQLPPLNVTVAENRTSVAMFSYKELLDLDKKEKVRACYQHACLKYVSNEKMTNQSLRDRFKIADHNYAAASRIIRDSLTEGVIKEDDPESRSRKYASYIPYWA
ncbi:Predicted transcriptional regulator, contains HTH domain [Dyadobacter soli]|uniref:Predicted transcriptional regulator, contains HTH domain n=1 Tax=Dyadobacter soli TaxID=659014 RepID=A0A1G7IKI1_9BACT|nr:RNA-binding domain-containing protein [Dyadobacter soli]SDF13211.1 Predicted transcriptional regulator, contains HTH domain [Dyadobacter soli]